MALRFTHRLMVTICKMAILSAAFSFAGCIQENSQSGSKPDKSQLPNVKTTEKAVAEGNLLVEGAELFAKLCSACHGTAGNGRGSRSGPSLQRPELTYGSTSATIATSIRDGRPGGMPAFGHVFSPRQIEALTSYVLSLKK